MGMGEHEGGGGGRRFGVVGRGSGLMCLALGVEWVRRARFQGSFIVGFWNTKGRQGVLIVAF